MTCKFHFYFAKEIRKCHSVMEVYLLLMRKSKIILMKFLYSSALRDRIFGLNIKPSCKLLKENMPLKMKEIFPAMSLQAAIDVLN